MTELKIYKCFISSPGDCTEERRECKKIINAVNNGLAKHLGVNFETFMWEDDVLTDMGKSGQEIIDDEIVKSKYDVFIGLMKNRFGHPTKKAGSGTEHELNDALTRKIDSKNTSPKILFFFGQEKVNPDNFDFEQFRKVKEFKKKVSPNGLYNEYSGIEDFKLKLTKKLELLVRDLSPEEKPKERILEIDQTLRKLEADFDESMIAYNEKSPIWIEPIISSKRQIPNSPNKNEDSKVDVKSIIEGAKDLVIKAPSEFGLTTLAHHIKLEAWKSGKAFLYIDSKKTKKHKIVKDIKKQSKDYFYRDIENINCIIIDSVSFEEPGMMRMIKNVCEEFLDIPLIILHTIDNNFFLKTDEDDKVEIKRNFTSYYLLPLKQNEVRKIVKSYTETKSIQEDYDIILNKVTKDLETLNMHRTAKNCISVLRASSKIGREYAPINRTKLLETILNTIFDEYEIPTYHDKKPDVKECSFVLGYFCELLLKKSNFEFEKDYFLNRLRTFCNKHYIDLDLNYLFNALIDNSIFSSNITNNIFYFRNSYWVFYFVAQRMNMDKDFLKFIYEGRRYIDFPEVIEFYTGIDRNKDDAINILNNDLTETIKKVRDKVKLPKTINPYKSIKWTPDVDTLKKEEEKIGEDIISSGLPDEIKDKYDDRNYNQIRPYNQVINSVIREYSFRVLMQQVSAASRALRNSDFVNAETKKQLLDNISESWNEISKLLIVLSPLLADKGDVTFEGASFHLDEEDFKNFDQREKRKAVLLSVPTNVVKFFKDDLFSNKMGPLIINKAETETNSLIKHEFMILLVAERPKGWNKVIDNYIVNLDKNSFFLSDILTVLNFNKKYKTTEFSEKRIIDHLSKKCRAKHIFKKENPDMGLIQKFR